MDIDIPMELDEGVHIFSGVVITVDFTTLTDSDDECENTSSEFTAQDNGSFSSSSISLVDYPAGGSSRCFYTVDFDSEVTIGVHKLKRQTNSTLAIDNTIQSPEIEADYASVFALQITFVLPDRDSANSLTGTLLVATFDRDPRSPSGCISRTLVYQVQSDGDAELLFGQNNYLLDRPTEQLFTPGALTTCEYILSSFVSSNASIAFVKDEAFKFSALTSSGIAEFRDTNTG